ncbi:DUF2239 family protein [Bdellovibrio bacteriovorus]|uniref:DUF2239 family protein n=1 Tax=Bdellovibrio bacteriovorus TaxID=959 RepID=UPI0035A68341
MVFQLDREYTAFADAQKIASGDLRDVVVKVKEFLKDESKATVLIFDAVTSQQVEVDLRGTAATIVKRIEESSLPSDEKIGGRGRPKLGVVPREVTLLPQHWEWLASQPGGASVTLRKLVEEAKKKNAAKDQLRMAQDATYKFMNVMAGNLPSYEEALRALYAKDHDKFSKLIAKWPKDIKHHVQKISEAAF